jgi:hypothetical protein
MAWEQQSTITLLYRRYYLYTPAHTYLPMKGLVFPTNFHLPDQRLPPNVAFPRQPLNNSSIYTKAKNSSPPWCLSSEFGKFARSRLFSLPKTSREFQVEGAKEGQELVVLLSFDHQDQLRFSTRNLPKVKIRT